jgi:hypothetical protein
VVVTHPNSKIDQEDLFDDNWTQKKQSHLSGPFGLYGQPMSIEHPIEHSGGRARVAHLTEVCILVKRTQFIFPLRNNINNNMYKRLSLFQRSESLLNLVKPSQFWFRWKLNCYEVFHHMSEVQWILYYKSFSL